MKLAYLLEDTAIGGSVRTALAQADALTARGHSVRVVTKGLPLTWRPTRAEWVYVDEFRQYDAREDDFVIGTSWITVPLAYEIAGDRAVHLCRGYEGAAAANQTTRAEIDAAYRLPIPRLVVSRALIPIVQQFTKDVTDIGQIVDEELYRARGPREHEPMRVLLPGQSQSEMKGLEDAYGAVAHARWFHQTFDLIRVSPWAPSREEPVDSVQEFHVALSTAEMTRVMHSCDVLIAPNHREDGFGLPAAEALASGIPTLLTSIPSYLAWDDGHDYALFAPEYNAVELGERLIELLSDIDLRERLRIRGRAVAEQWRAEHVAERLEKFFAERKGEAKR